MANQPRRSRGKRTEVRPVDEAARCAWRRGLNFQASSLMLENSGNRKRTAVCLLQGRGDARSKSRAPQPGAALPIFARDTNGDRIQ